TKHEDHTSEALLWPRPVPDQESRYVVAPDRERMRRCPVDGVEEDGGFRAMVRPVVEKLIEVHPHTACCVDGHNLGCLPPPSHRPFEG
uniref:Uncharacterized protein n=1 Tax=Aegilops tauschii subsp. strangulata TaxID=200361 RepID=A0A453E4Q4_AEGTS